MKDYQTISPVDEEGETAKTGRKRTSRVPAEFPPTSLSPPSYPHGSGAESDRLLTNSQFLSAIGRTRPIASSSSSSSAATAVACCSAGAAREGIPLEAGCPASACGGHFLSKPKWAGSTPACPLPRACAVLPPEKALISHGPCGQQPWGTWNDPGSRRRSRLCLYLLLAAFMMLAFFALYEDNRDGHEEPLNYSPMKSYHFLENRQRLFGTLSESVPGFVDPSNKIKVLVPASRRPHRHQSDSEYDGWRQASNVVYVMGEFNVADSAILLTAKPVDERKRKKKAFPTCSDSHVEEASGAELDSATAAGIPRCDDSDERASYTDLDVDVYMPNLHIREKVFGGELPTAETLRHENKVSSVGFIDPGFVDDLDANTVILSPEPESEFLVPLFGDDIIARLAEKNVTVKYSFEVHQAFVEARFVKSPEELRILKFASKMSAETHRKLESYMIKKKKISEIELASYFKDQAARRRLRLQAYPPIVGAGRHGAILHYRTGENTTAGYAPIEKNTFVLVDAAGEYHGYASDITRTITRKKHWSKEMKEVYKIVKTVQQEALDYFVEGRSWSDITGFATETLVKQLLYHNFIVGDDLQLLINSGVHSVFMPHSLGHPVGLDVHDPIPAKYKVPSFQSIPGYDKMPVYLRELVSYSPCLRSASSEGAPSSDFTIVRGYVSTIEPGVYFIPLLFDLVLNDPEGPGQFINWEKINRGAYFELGGVRIEDVVMIDWEGKKQIISKF